MERRAGDGRRDDGRQPNARASLPPGGDRLPAEHEARQAMESLTLRADGRAVSYGEELG